MMDSNRYGFRNNKQKGIPSATQHQMDSNQNSFRSSEQPSLPISSENCMDVYQNDTACKIVRPLITTMAVFGLFHFHSKEKRWYLVTKIYSTSILLILWAYVILFFTVYRDEGIGQSFFMKLNVHTWSFWGASVATTTYLACRKQNKIIGFLIGWSKLLKRYREQLALIDYARQAKLRVYSFLFFTWIIFITSCVTLGYVLFATSFGDFLLSPLALSHMYVLVLKSLVFLCLLYLTAAWIFTLCLYFTVGGLTYREFGILHEDFQNAVGADGNIVGLENYRRRHQEICLLVEKADDILSEYNAVSILMSTVSGMLVLYSLITYPENNTETLLLASNLFWVMSCLMYMVVVAIGGGYLNHMAHSPLSTIHNIHLKEFSTEVSMQMTMFLSKLTGQPIGLTAMGMFVIDKPTILTIAGVFLTYFVVLLQFKQQETQDVRTNCANVTT